MRISIKLRWLLIVFVSLLSQVQAEQRLEHQGREILSFDIPELVFLRQREGRRTRTFFSRTLEEGKLKVTVTSQAWVRDGAVERGFKSDQQTQRKTQSARLLRSPKIAGVEKVLAYEVSWPFEAKALVLYHKDFRCKFLISGTGTAKELIEPSFEELKDSLKILPRFQVRADSVKSK